MRATQYLIREHQFIWMALDVLEKFSLDLIQGRDVFRHYIHQTLDFLALVADHAHHGKEEELLFPHIDETGLINTGGPSCVLYMGRQMIRHLNDGEVPKGNLPPKPSVSSRLDIMSPLHGVIEEHREGRYYASLMRESLEGNGNAEKFFDCSRRYVGLLREHIEKENNCLFVMVNAALPEPHQKKLAEDFEAFDHSFEGHAKLFPSLEEMKKLWESLKPF